MKEQVAMLAWIAMVLTVLLFIFVTLADAQTVTVTTSETIVEDPGVLYYTEAATGTRREIDLSGTVPGTTFTGTFPAAVPDGACGTFSHPANALVDAEGNKGSTITSGAGYCAPTNSPCVWSALWTLPSEFVSPTETSRTYWDDATYTQNTFAIDMTFQTSDLYQTGPARLLTNSSGPPFMNRNWTIAQVGENLKIRLRLQSGWVREDVLRDVLTGNEQTLTIRHTGETYTITVDGVTELQEDFIWAPRQFNDTYNLYVGSESGEDHPWEGTISSITVYECTY